jgi:hypothetical protein
MIGQTWLPFVTTFLEVKVMFDLQTERLRFNRRADELVRNVISQDVGTPEFRAEHVKMCDLLRRVAEHDPALARELLISVFMFSYTFAIGATRQPVS